MKNKEKGGEKKSNDSYTPKKTPRPKSFIEDISKKHIERMKKIA